ncbi:ATP synthase subunit B family protein [Salegentibacter mishustinae]|uniref:Uncharacterized protein n=1 Tax=Salegentibacter mishustinae TaxID=270918 RepID=A0A0Q9Z889_9FLAO|nr:hypothetical protein [Salegentibacter mishustinae]KRG28233.1 hypothetical protein APR42_05450 [Salegentibacter mishustinae]PNW22168.1 hypothetical protein APB85_13215 [Salegentibacter mishustinae]PZX67385.1 hypothetical protein LY54_00115 [Salegentibacter mishustinae]
MSRSKRKTPILTNGKAPSEKDEKQKANRKLRRIVKEKLAVLEEELPQKKEVSDRWNWEKDGKSYRADLTKKEKTK